MRVVDSILVFSVVECGIIGTFEVSAGKIVVQAVTVVVIRAHSVYCQVDGRCVSGEITDFSVGFQYKGGGPGFW